MAKNENSKKWQEGWQNVKTLKWVEPVHEVTFSLSAIAFFYIRTVGLSQQRWGAYDLIRMVSGVVMALCWYGSLYFEPANKENLKHRETQVILAVMAVILLIVVEIGMTV